MDLQEEEGVAKAEEGGVLTMLFLRPKQIQVLDLVGKLTWSKMDWTTTTMMCMMMNHPISSKCVVLGH